VNRTDHRLTQIGEANAEGRTMRYPRIIKIILAITLTGCAATPQWIADKPLPARQQDVVECSAMAAQAAQGTGSWSSDRAIRTGLFENARDQYLAMCLQSRGWYQGSPAPVTSAQNPPVSHARRCLQLALSRVGGWNGPVDATDSPSWQDTWAAYVESRNGLAHRTAVPGAAGEQFTPTERITAIRAINAELAATGASINWQSCELRWGIDQGHR
jgi:hypothetical protein